MKYFKIYIAPLLFCLTTVLPCLLATGTAGAASQSFSVLNDQAQTGMLMSLTPDAGVIAPANNRNSASLIGVITTDNASLSQQPGQISVATDGQADALVSTIDGDIRVGDRIGPSVLTGVGGKLKANGWMVGVAQASLDSKTKKAVVTTLTDNVGGKHTVYLARIPIIVKVTYFNMSTSSNQSDQPIPKTVQDIADKLAGKHVSVLGLFLSFILMVIGIVWASLVVYTAVKGSMDAISRQPLAKAVINMNLLRSLGLAAAVVIGVLVGGLILLRVL